MIVCRFFFNVFFFKESFPWTINQIKEKSYKKVRTHDQLHSRKIVHIETQINYCALCRRPTCVVFTVVINFEFHIFQLLNESISSWETGSCQQLYTNIFFLFLLVLFLFKMSLCKRQDTTICVYGRFSISSSSLTISSRFFLEVLGGGCVLPLTLSEAIRFHFFRSLVLSPRSWEITIAWQWWFFGLLLLHKVCR